MNTLLAERCNPDGNVLIEWAPRFSKPPVATVWYGGNDGVRLARLFAAAEKMEAALKAMRDCRGIDDTEQTTGETFRTIIEAALPKEPVNVVFDAKEGVRRVGTDGRRI